MTTGPGDELVARVVDRYRAKTPGSARFDTSSRRRFPGGTTSLAHYIYPHALCAAEGRGCRLRDVDGNVYLDALNNFASLIHGHAHPAVVEAVREQVERGAVFGTASGVQLALADALCRRVPGIEQLQFTNSGTEATMMAMRLARGFTGRDLILKMDGGYHGTHDLALANVRAGVELTGEPAVRFAGEGIPAYQDQGVLVSRFNDLELTSTLLDRHAGRVAAIVVEPVPGVGGLMEPRAGYLEGLRDLADEHGALLVFDEVLSFRLAPGGVQERAGVLPDLTTLGKLIGGGFPIGAFGGREEVMRHCDPLHPHPVMHAGTFNGHNVAMAAGLATLEAYDAAEVARLNRLGDRLRASFDDALRRTGLLGRALGVGSLTQIHWTDCDLPSPGHAARELQSAGYLPMLLHLEMASRGVLCAGRGLFVLSTPMTETEVDEGVAAFAATLEALVPYVEACTPHLLDPSRTRTGSG